MGGTGHEYQPVPIGLPGSVEAIPLAYETMGDLHGSAMSSGTGEMPGTDSLVSTRLNVDPSRRLSAVLAAGSGGCHLAGAGEMTAIEGWCPPTCNLRTLAQSRFVQFKLSLLVAQVAKCSLCNSSQPNSLPAAQVAKCLMRGRFQCKLR